MMHYSLQRKETHALKNDFKIGIFSEPIMKSKENVHYKNNIVFTFNDEKIAVLNLMCLIF